MKSLLLLIPILAMSGCISFGRESIPEFPPRLETSAYQQQIEEAKHNTSRPVCSIAGARLAEDGIYIDLVFTNINPLPDVNPEGGSGPNLFWSDFDDPSSVVELRGPSDEIIRLRPRQRPRMRGIFLPGTCILYAEPPLQLVERGETLSYLGVCMFRTQRQLAPGMYVMRLQPPPPPESEDAWIWQCWGGFEMDTTAHEVRVEWAASNAEPDR